MSSPTLFTITRNSNALSGDGSNGNYIEHTVSKMDTLAGVAIKYGVEVSDIKRMNGLVTDLQMFALKSLQIPLPGRHPPSPSLSNGSASPRESNFGTIPPPLGRSHTPDSCQPRRLKSPQLKVSPAMSTLHDFYGLKPPNPKGLTEGTEMAIYKRGMLDYSDSQLSSKVYPISDPQSNGHKSRFLSNGFLSEIDKLTKDMPVSEDKDGEGDRYNENSVRRRQKAETDSGSDTPERLLKEENGSSSFSPITGKNLAMRPKSVCRAGSVADGESGWLSSNPSSLGDPLSADGLARVHKSSSLSSLQEQENCMSSSSIWSHSKWSLKQDLQAFSTSSLAKPLLEGLPITGRRNKAALD